MSDALPRNITLIGRLKKERITGSPRRIHEILHESMRNGPFDRGSIPCGVCLKEKPPLPEALSSIGAAYRIRTYDVLIRSQTLYPAEVTPQRMDYYARDPSMGQATIWKNFTK